MTTLLDEPRATTEVSTSAAQRLRATTAAVRLSFTWFGVRKSLSREQKALAAEPFAAEGEYLAASKKICDTKHPAFRAVTAIRGRVQSVWKSTTLPYPEPGVRLIRQNQIEEFDDRMRDFREELREAVANLDAHYAELRAAARRRLGSLYNAADYPETLVGLFGMEWDYPAVEPPEYLRMLSPSIFDEERRRVAARFEEAVQLAEQAFTEELSKLVSHLTERLSGVEDGRPKVFRDTAVNNLTEFFQRFRQLNIRSNEELDELVSQAQQVVRGVAPQDLRDSAVLRQHVAQQLGQVQQSLDSLMVERPRRRIIRSGTPQEGV